MRKIRVRAGRPGRQFGAPGSSSLLCLDYLCRCTSRPHPGHARGNETCEEHDRSLHFGSRLSHGRAWLLSKNNAFRKCRPCSVDYFRPWCGGCGAKHESAGGDDRLLSDARRIVRAVGAGLPVRCEPCPGFEKPGRSAAPGRVDAIRQWLQSSHAALSLYRMGPGREEGRGALRSRLDPQETVMVNLADHSEHSQLIRQLSQQLRRRIVEARRAPEGVEQIRF